MWKAAHSDEAVGFPKGSDPEGEGVGRRPTCLKSARDRLAHLDVVRNWRLLLSLVESVCLMDEPECRVDPASWSRLVRLKMGLLKHPEPLAEGATCHGEMEGLRKQCLTGLGETNGAPPRDVQRPLRNPQGVREPGED